MAEKENCRAGAFLGPDFSGVSLPHGISDIERAGRVGKTTIYQGAFTKLTGIGERIAPRSFTRKFAGKMNH